MAVYERTYRRYTGAVTPAWSRFLVLPRYAYRDVFRSKLLVGFFALAFVPPLLAAILIYVRHNADALEALGVQLPDLLDINASFFENLLLVQGRFAFFLTLFIGPGLISRDLANNGLPLYLSRPISRADYVLGKLAVLLILLSAVTWLPGLLLFVMNGNLEGWSWLFANLRIGVGVFFASWLWILLLALLALALSAWVKWRTVAGFVLLVIFFSGSFFGHMANLLFRTDQGHILNPGHLIKVVLAGLMGTDLPRGPSLLAATLVLSLLAAFSLWLLHRKIRAYEVVR